MWKIGSELIGTIFYQRLMEKINSPKVMQEIEKAMNEAFEKTFEQYHMEWNPMILKEYLAEEEEKSINTILYMTSDKMLDIMRRYPKADAIKLDEQGQEQEREQYTEGLEEITEQWIDDWRTNCLEELSKSAPGANYLILQIITEEKRKKNEDEEKNVKDLKQLAEAIEKDIDKSRRENMYDNLIMLNRTVYPYVYEHLVRGCSDMVIDIAYALTDIYDHVSEYEKSKEIGERIYNILTEENRVYSIKQLRMLVGCTYSITIAKVPLQKKREFLAKAENQFKVIKEYINHWQPDDMLKWNEFLAMFESDYAAWYMNMGDMEKNENDELSKEYYAKALQHHKKGEEYRQEVYNVCMCKHVNKSDEEEALRVLYQSKSNIAGVLYRMGEYDKAIAEHKDILKYRETSRHKSDVCLTQEYIAGAYIEKWKRDNILDEEKQECIELLNMCKAYYKENRDESRLQMVEEKIIIINNLRGFV